MLMNDKVVQFRGTVYELGSGMVSQKVMRDVTLSRDAKALYAYLCSFAWGNTDNERSAFPSVSMQCRELAIKTEKSYYNYRKELLIHGYISIEKSRNGGGKFKNNTYYIEAVPTSKTEQEVKNMLKGLNNAASEPHGKKDSVVKNTNTHHTVKKPSVVETILGQKPPRLKEGVNKRTSSIKKELNKEEKKDNKNNVVVGLQTQILDSFFQKISKQEVTNLISLAEQNKKDLTEVIEQTSKHFKGKQINNLIGCINHGITTGWDQPKKAVTSKPLPQSIKLSTKQVTNMQPAEDNEDLEDTYADIRATMKFLKSTERSVLKH